MMSRTTKRNPSFEELRERKDILVRILRKRPQEVSQEVLRVRHQIQNAQHNGYFLNYCCDLCYSELYCEDPSLPEELTCPGCGWSSSQISSSAMG